MQSNCSCVFRSIIIIISIVIIKTVKQTNKQNNHLYQRSKQSILDLLSPTKFILSHRYCTCINPRLHLLARPSSTRRIRYTPQSHDISSHTRNIHTSHQTLASAITKQTTTISKMSPIIARAAIRATRATAQGQQFRQFSVMRTMRNVARSFESHPFQRLPIANSTQAADWSRQFKRVGGQAVV